MSQEPEKRKVLIAIWKSVDYGGEIVCISDSIEVGDSDSYVRVSEFLEVEFTRLPKETITQAALGTLTRQEETIRRRAIAELNKIAKAKAELLQITYEEKPDVQF